MAAVLIASAAHSESPPVASADRLGLLKSQTSLLDGREADQYTRSIRIDPNPILIPGTPEARRAALAGQTSPFIRDAQLAATRAGVPEAIFLKLIHQESGWNPHAVSPKGARGLAQLMPGTASLLRVRIDDPVANLNGGARYLRMMYDRFGRWDLALAAYNAGPEAVQQHGGIPPFAETRAYVRAILGTS